MSLQHKSRVRLYCLHLYIGIAYTHCIYSDHHHRISATALRKAKFGFYLKFNLQVSLFFHHLIESCVSFVCNHLTIHISFQYLVTCFVAQNLLMKAAQADCYDS